jgi:hypothetical protein
VSFAKKREQVMFAQADNWNILYQNNLVMTTIKGFLQWFRWILMESCRDL